MIYCRLEIRFAVSVDRNYFSGSTDTRKFKDDSVCFRNSGAYYTYLYTYV